MEMLGAHATTVRGEGEPVVVLAHGLGGTQAHWAPIADHLARRCTVVTFDLAASGHADPSVFSPVRHADVTGFADDLAGVCAALGVRGGCFVGHSISAAAGIVAAVADPGLFSRLVLIGASARYIDEPATGYVGGYSQDAIDELFVGMRSNFDLWSAGFAPLVMQNGDRPDLARDFAASLRRYRPDHALTVFTAAFTCDLRDIVPRVTVPTLLIQASNDPAVPLEAATWLAAHLPDSTLHVLTAEGHLPHVADPDAVISLLDEFLPQAGR